MRELRLRELEVLAKSHSGKIWQSPSLSIFKAGICPLCNPVLAHQQGLKKMRAISAHNEEMLQGEYNV